LVGIEQFCCWKSNRNIQTDDLGMMQHQINHCDEKIILASVIFQQQLSDLAATFLGQSLVIETFDVDGIKCHNPCSSS